jgi:hypothetical protein
MLKERPKDEQYLICPFCHATIELPSKADKGWCGGNKDMVGIECAYCGKDFDIDEKDWDLLYWEKEVKE